jgi:hypothetical protein
VNPTPFSESTWLEQARDTLLAAHDALPRADQVLALQQELATSVERGYFSPEEDDRIRMVFCRYLHIRSALTELLVTVRRKLPLFRRHLKEEDLQLFIAGWLAGCMLMRTSRYVVKEFYDQPLLYDLLNREDASNSIPAGTLDRVYRLSTRPANVIRFFWAVRIAEAHADDIEALRDHPLTGPLLPLLEAEDAFIERQKRKHASAYAKCRVARIRNTPIQHYRAVMWEIFEHSGRFIAECRNPFHRKRVKRSVQRRLAKLLHPGDILVTRHDDALSNLFLPGFWPHAALCLGTPAQREALGVEFSEQHQAELGPGMTFLEARKDGVKFRRLADTLSVDSCVVVRPAGLTDPDRKRILERAETHAGKLYDFEFDFTRPDRLVCTEVIYRSMDGIHDIHFDLIRKAGRFTLPAEELLRQALDPLGFEVIMIYGIHGNHWADGDRARDFLHRTLQTA